MRTDLISRQAALAAFEDACDYHGVIMAIKALPSVIPKDRWIPCDEKMPENDATVLATVDIPSGAPKVLEMSYYNGRWYRNDMLVSPWWVVIAWRQMPKPYKGEQE